MDNTYFSEQLRVRAILLTGRDSIILIHHNTDKPYWTAPGGQVRDDDPDDESALQRELREILGVEIKIVDVAMRLFMSRWNFYICRLMSIDRSLRDPKRGPVKPAEIPLDETALREINVQPRALRDYLLGHLDDLRASGSEHG